MKGVLEVVIITVLILISCLLLGGSKIIATEASELNSIERVGIHIDHKLAQLIIDNRGLSSEQVASLVKALPKGKKVDNNPNYSDYSYVGVVFNKRNKKWYIILERLPII